MGAFGTQVVPATYTELNAVLHRRTGHRPFRFEDASERAALGYLLGRIVERDYPIRCYMLSALVIYLNGNDPGSGFYALATQMGLLVDSSGRTVPGRWLSWT